MRKWPYYLIVFFVIILTSIIMAGCPTPEVIEEPGSKWVQVPLRNVEQKVKGYFGGETGQMAFSIDICEANPDYLALAIDTAGVYISKDGANSWQLKRQGIMCNGVQSIAFDPGNPQNLWAAGLNGTLPNPQVEGIYRTMDGGETWTLHHTAVYQKDQAQNEYFAFDPDSFDGTQHNTVYVATHDQGLLKTINGGETWQSLGFQNEKINAIIIHPLNQDLLFLASETGLYISENAGNTFFKVEGGLPVSSPVLGLAVNAQDPDVIFVAIGSNGIWRSMNSGQNFYSIMNGIPEWAIDQQWSWRRLCISPVDPNQIYVDANWGGPFPYWSNNGGDAWHQPEFREACFFDLNPADPNHWQPEGFVAHPEDPNIAYHVTPVRKTTDGGRTWHYSSDGISGMRRIGRTSMTFHPDDPNKMALFHIDFGCAYTNDGGDTFSYCPAPRHLDSFSMLVGAYEPVAGSKKLISVIGGWHEQSICISTDNCLTWDILSGTEGDYQFIAFNQQNPNIVYMGRKNDSVRSRDGGVTWTQLAYPIRTMYPGNGDIVFAPRLTSIQWEWEILKSDDQGDNWVALPGRIEAGSLSEIDVDPTNPNRLYAASNSGIWVFDGTGWTVRNEQHGLTKNIFGYLTFQFIAVDPRYPNIIYAGQNECWSGISAGIFRSTDYGQTWENINFNFGPDLTIWAITVSPYDSSVWIGTDYGNWKLESE